MRLAPLALLLILAPACRSLAAARFLEDALQPSPELAGKVVERRERIAGVDVRFYASRELDGASPTVLLCHGASETGADDKRLISVARAFAVRGALVATPDLPSLRAARVDPQDPVRLARIAAHLPGKTALVGISIAGTYGIIAAGETDMERHVSCVLAFGTYDDLEALLHAWLVGREADALYTYVRRYVLLGNVDALVPRRDRVAVRPALRALLKGDEMAALPHLSRRGRHCMAAARATGPLDPALASALLSPLSPEFEALTVRVAPTVPVFLLHGKSDPLVPVGESRRLHARLKALGADVELHETELLTHPGEADATPSFLRAWPLLRFVGRFLSAAGL